MPEFLEISLLGIIAPATFRMVLVNLNTIQTVDIDQYGYAIFTFDNGTKRNSNHFYVDIVKQIQNRYVNYI